MALERFGVLALDLATTTGYAMERPGGAEPIMGTEKFSVSRDAHPGKKQALLIDWLYDAVRTFNPERVIYEAPFNSSNVQGEDGKQIGNTQTMEDLISLGKAVDLITYRLDLPVNKAPVQSVRKVFCGSGRAKKPDVMTECLRRGWNPMNGDEADAAALLDYAIFMFFKNRYIPRSL